MKPFFLSAFFAASILSAASAAAQTEEAFPWIRLRSGQIKCGDALVTAEARCLVFPENQTQCASQVLRLTNNTKGISKSLALDGKLIIQDFVKEGPVLDAYVSSWTCLASQSGKSYLFLAYVCVESDKRPKCVGTNREWSRLFDTEGNNLTAGYRRHGPQIDRLMKRLGIKSNLREGIKIRGITEPPLIDAPQGAHQ